MIPTRRHCTYRLHRGPRWLLSHYFNTKWHTYTDANGALRHVEYLHSWCRTCTTIDSRERRGSSPQFRIYSPTQRQERTRERNRLSRTRRMQDPAYAERMRENRRMYYRLRKMRGPPS